MTQDRHDPVDLFTQIEGLTLQFNPVLAQLDRLLEDDELFQHVRSAMAKRRPRSASCGRRSTPVEVVLRLLVVMRLYGWSFAETEYHVADSLVLRQFCRIYMHAVPDDTTLIRWCGCLGPDTVQALHARVVALAVRERVTHGRKLRLDTTVVRTHIHHPTDSALLTDGVRVLSRLCGQARTLLAAVGAAATAGAAAFRNRTRSMRRRSRELRQVSRGKGKAPEAKRAALQQLYAGMLAITRRALAQAQRVQAALTGAADALAAAGERVRRAGERVRQQLREYLPRVEQVLAQARRRTQWGEAVPAAEKLLSLFETHTQLIQRGKARQAQDTVEFGRKLWVSEVEGGIVSDYGILAQPNQDATYVAERLERHREQFGHAPRAVTGDRGLYSTANVAAAAKAGSRRVAFPAPGRRGRAQPAHEQERWFRELYRWRAGVEGRISVLQRGFGLAVCLYHGEAGMERWVGWGILTHNLRQIARAKAAA